MTAIKIAKELLKFNSKKKNEPIRKPAKDLNALLCRRHGCGTAQEMTLTDMGIRALPVTPVKRSKERRHVHAQQLLAEETETM